MKNHLLDKDFLYELSQYKHKEKYARIISLSFNESPLEQIEGRVVSGSINIDGNSILRRTCNLSLVAKDINITDFYWGISNKFSLEIGLKNYINPEYPDIIWFKQGVFVISSFNSALTQNNYSISISGKDKMCLFYTCTYVLFQHHNNFCSCQNFTQPNRKINLSPDGLNTFQRSPVKKNSTVTD